MALEREKKNLTFILFTYGEMGTYVEIDGKLYVTKEDYLNIVKYYENSLSAERNGAKEEIEELEKENKKLKEENDRLKNNAMEDMRVQTKLEEKIRFLEECLDRKEKLNEKYRKEIEKLKSTYVYDAKQVRDIC